MSNAPAIKMAEFRITENGRKFMEGQNRKDGLNAANHDAITNALHLGSLRTLKILRRRIPSITLTHDKVTETVSVSRHGALLATWHFRKMDASLGWGNPTRMVGLILDNDGNAV